MKMDVMFVVNDGLHVPDGGDTRSCKFLVVIIALVRVALTGSYCLTYTLVTE